MSFLYPMVFWIGLPLVALPLVIHLLNLRRQQRIQWAAMDFLLESQQKSKTWINLKELLLLLLRTAAIALLVLLLARPTSQSGWLGRLLNRPVHHLIVLDDSYSTTDRWAETTAWQEALGAVADITNAAAEQSSASVITVLRFSESEVSTEDPRPAIFRRPLDDKTRQELLSRIETEQPTDAASGILPALRRASELASLQSTDQDLVVHIVSDFRQRTMNELDAIQQAVKDLESQVTELQFVRSVRQQHDNLAITRLEPASGNRAAGVEMWMEVSVKNYGVKTARDVVVELEQDGSPMVAVPMGDIQSGSQVDRRFRATFVGSGSHWLAGTIDADAVDVDNRRVFASQIPEAQRILLIDGSPKQWESYYVSTALAPGGSTRSGWQPEVISPRELDKVNSLEDFAAVALLDVPKVSDEQLVRLQSYVSNGGGLFITLGESIKRDFWTGQAFDQGNGLLPAPPDLPTQWLPARDDTNGPVADIRVEDHPVFGIFRGERNSMLGLMRINYYYSLKRLWKNENTSDVRTLAKLSDGSPLVMEKPYGKGKVVTQYTKISPDQGSLGSWSNLGPNPAFVVLANELFGYLAHGAAADKVLIVGDQVRIPLDRNQYVGSGTIQSMSKGSTYQATLETDPTAEEMAILTDPIERAGLYELEIDRAAGGTETRLAAVNPIQDEGELQLIADSTLRQKFSGEQFSLRYADELSSEANPSESNWTELLLTILVLALVAEQAMAYVCSFHD